MADVYKGMKSILLLSLLLGTFSQHLDQRGNKVEETLNSDGSSGMNVAMICNLTALIFQPNHIPKHTR